MADDLRAQGITFYSVEGVGKANEIEQLTF
jgi:hypothetical protein